MFHVCLQGKKLKLGHLQSMHTSAILTGKAAKRRKVILFVTCNACLKCVSEGLD